MVGLCPSLLAYHSHIPAAIGVPLPWALKHKGVLQAIFWIYSHRPNTILYEKLKCIENSLEKKVLVQHTINSTLWVQYLPLLLFSFLYSTSNTRISCLQSWVSIKSYFSLFTTFISSLTCIFVHNRFLQIGSKICILSQLIKNLPAFTELTLTKENKEDYETAQIISYVSHFIFRIGLGFCTTQGITTK